MNDVMCKGDFRLGTACGKCSRCVAAEALRPENQRMYPVGTERNWQAELDAQRLRADTAEAERDALRALLQRVVDSSVLSFEADAPEELESLEVDICAALNPNPEAEGRERLCPGCGAKGWTANCDQCIPY